MAFFWDWFTKWHVVFLWIMGILLIASGAIGLTIYNAPGGNEVDTGYYTYNVISIVAGIIIFLTATVGILNRKC